MDIETKGLGAGSYPEPLDEETKYINGKIHIYYEFKEIEVPDKWDKEKILEDIRENISYYIENSNEEIEEVEING